MGKEQESSFPCASLGHKVVRGGVKPPRFFFSLEELSALFDLPEDIRRDAKKVEEFFPVRIPEFYLNLMNLEDPSCPLKRQAFPSIDELSDSGYVDPLGEEKSSLTMSFIKRYPGRGVFLVSSQCAMFCRFCNRRRLLGMDSELERSWDETFKCMEKLEDLHEVILSGGDPFMQGVEKLRYVLERIKGIRKIRTIRISTRVPVVFPQGVSEELVRTLRMFRPLWIVIHINHPKEVSEEFKKIVRDLQMSGLQILSQTVLLRGVNDCARTLIDLFETLVSLGVKPYYLFQLDEVKGACHFKVKLSQGTKIYRALRMYASGLAIPSYVIDITGGLGKVQVTESIIGRDGKTVLLRTPEGRIGRYSDDGYDSECKKCGLCDEI